MNLMRTLLCVLMLLACAQSGAAMLVSSPSNRLYPAVFLQNNANVVFLAPGEYKVLDWQVEVYDDLASHDLAANISRITIPSGVTRARFGFTLDIQAAASDQTWTMELHRNGAIYSQLGQVQVAAGKYGVWTFASAAVPVSAGDFFQIKIDFAGATLGGTLVSSSVNYATCFWSDFY